MRTNIVIDDKLMEDALRTTGLKTKREVVELGLNPDPPQAAGNDLVVSREAPLGREPRGDENRFMILVDSGVGGSECYTVMRDRYSDYSVDHQISFYCSAYRGNPLLCITPELSRAEGPNT